LANIIDIARNIISSLKAHESFGLTLINILMRIFQMQNITKTVKLAIKVGRVSKLNNSIITPYPSTVATDKSITTTPGLYYTSFFTTQRVRRSSYPYRRTTEEIYGVIMELFMDIHCIGRGFEC